MTLRILLFALVAALSLGASVSSAADIRRIEAVGSVPIRADQRSSVGPKEAAIDSALREAVYRVAHDFLLESDARDAEGEASDSELAALRPALGDDMVRYTRSFRIIEDRGERPAMFVEDDGAPTEYVVIVEVQVDAGRVEKRLVDRGLIQRAKPSGVSRVVKVEVMGLEQYAAYEQLRSLILERLGAKSVSPLELERGRSLLAIETRLSPAELLHRLLAVAPANMEISPLAAESDSVRLMVYWTPPPGEETGAAVGGAASPAGRDPGGR